MSLLIENIRAEMKNSIEELESSGKGTFQKEK